MHAVLDSRAMLASSRKDKEWLAMGACHAAQMARLCQILAAWKNVPQKKRARRCVCSTEGVQLVSSESLKL
jgi:hypothetical protein